MKKSETIAYFLQRYLLLLFFFLSLTGCNPIVLSPQANLKIATANILITNTNKIEEDLLALDCDIYLLHEAVLNINIDGTPFIERGYNLYSHSKSSINAFNGVVISRIEGEFKPISLEYTYGNWEVVSITPFYSYNFTYLDKSFSVIGVHIPPEVFMPEDVKSLRIRAINDLSLSINNGMDDLGREVIVAGDFNTFPSDEILYPILNSALNDSIIYSRNRYYKTWKPNISPLSLARIDYIFVSKNINTEYSDFFSIKGSDHRGVMVGIEVK